MLRPASLPEDHEDLFVARYPRLLRWAERLTEGQRAVAEDLVQDAFVQFTVKRPRLAAIENLDDYLYAMMRNLHISQVRRASQSQTTQLLISDYDTAHMGLRLLDPQRRLLGPRNLPHASTYFTSTPTTP